MEQNRMLLPNKQNLKDVFILAGFFCLLSPPVFGQMSPEENAAWEKTQGRVVGIVTSKETGKPLERVLVRGPNELLGGFTDPSGAFKTYFMEPGFVDLVAERPDLKIVKRRVEIKAGEKITVNFSMESAPEPCCRLEGVWEIELILGRWSYDRPRPENETIKGTVTFRDLITDREVYGIKEYPGDSTRVEFGWYDVNLIPWFGDEAAGFKELDRKIREEKWYRYDENGNIVHEKTPEDKLPPPFDETFLTEVQGFVFSENRVQLDFVPSAADVGLFLEGEISEKAIQGKWRKEGLASMAAGQFRMRRK